MLPIHRSRSLLAVVGVLPLLLTRAVPRGDNGGVPDDKDKENKNLTALLQRNNGDAMALAAQLLSENAGLRGERRDLRQKVEKTEGRTLKEGEVAISADKARLLTAYEAEGTPEELKKAKSERDAFAADKTRLEGEVTTLKTNDAKTKHIDHLRNVAEVEGYKASVLIDRDTQTPGLTYEIRDVVEEGKTVKRAFVKFKDGEGESAPLTEKPLGEFAAQKWGDYLPALQTTAQGTGGETPGGGIPGGTPHIEQGSGGRSAGGDVFANIRKKAEDANKTKAEESTPLETRFGMAPA